MMRVLNMLNLLGVLVLAALCTGEWVINRGLNLAKIELEKTRLVQQQQLAEKEQAIKGNIGDLDDFRARLQQTLDTANAAQAQVKSLTTERDKMVAQRDQLQSSVDALQAGLERWKAAVAQRDAALKEAAQTAEKLATDRNDAITKYNDLAVKFNDEVAQLKDANATIEKLTSERNDTIAKFNDLATRYNDLVKQAGAGTQPSGGSR